MNTKFRLFLLLSVLASTLLSSCESSGRGDRRTGGMSSWERSRR